MNGRQIAYTAVVSLLVVVAYDRYKGKAPGRGGMRVAN